MIYKNYEAIVEFDDDAGIFHGEVLGIRDIITFQGESVEELRTAFHQSVDDYLEFCKVRNESPEKPYSGKLVLRLKPELHMKLAIKAQKLKTSLNKMLSETLEKSI